MTWARCRSRTATRIGTGYEENGFGDYWNKVMPKMTIFQNRLYASTALNYEYGGQVWYTRTGTTGR